MSMSKYFFTPVCFRSAFLTGVGIALFGSALIADTAFAEEGVVEINQACALSGGCLNGDGAGFPVSISVAGSYRLTSNLVLPDANTTGITLTASNISIDLAGFAIIGPGLVGVGHGIDHQIGFEVRIYGGSVLGVGADGIRTNGRSSVADMRISDVGGTCILSKTNQSIIRDNQVARCGENGINSSGLPSLILGNTVIDAGTDGISAFSGVGIHRNVISGSGAGGINATITTVYSSNLLTENNGGSANPQVIGTSGIDLGSNVCGVPATCP